jgi:hypothetical protein
MWLCTFGLHKMLGNYQVATQLVASRVVLSSIELVSSKSKYTSKQQLFRGNIAENIDPHIASPTEF